MLTQFNSFTGFLCLHCWGLGLADCAECTVEVSIHHAVGVPMEVSQDDTPRMLLHLHSHRTVCSVLHGSAVTDNREETWSSENAPYRHHVINHDLQSCISPQDSCNTRFDIFAVFKHNITV